MATEILWRWPELCAALGLPPVEGPDISGISIDSRQVVPGDLFIALTGDPGVRFNPSQRSERDGHDFINAALANGAVGVLSHDALVRDCPELKVDDTLDGLWVLGRAGRARLNCPVIAITGSSGKTTTKTLLSAALGAFATPGSLNNHLGVPLSLVRTPRDVTAAVFEIGTSHPGEISPLSELASPDVAVLLNVHQAHVENFKDKAELVKEKISIINGLKDNSYFVVEDQVDISSLGRDLQVLRFGRSADADVQLIDVTGETASYQLTGELLTAHVPGGGAHRALSLAATIGVFVALGQDPKPALTLADDLVPHGRGNRIDINGITLIDDSYNANPASMAAALTALAAEPGRKVALLGEMLELGADSVAAHRGLSRLCGRLDLVVCVGQGMIPLVERLGPDCRYFAEPDRIEAPDGGLLSLLRGFLQPGDTLLVKGSNRVFWSRDFVAHLVDHLTS